MIELKSAAPLRTAENRNRCIYIYIFTPVIRSREYASTFARFVNGTKDVARVERNAKSRKSYRAFAGSTILSFYAFDFSFFKTSTLSNRFAIDIPNDDVTRIRLYAPPVLTVDYLTRPETARP